MNYKFDLNRILAAKVRLDRFDKRIPDGKKPKHIWKDTVSLVSNSGSRNRIFSKKYNIVNHQGTVEEAFDSLMKYANENKDKPVSERFMTFDEIEYWAKYMKNEYEEYSKEDNPLLLYIDYIISYYVAASFRGFNAEYEFCDWINSKLEARKLNSKQNRFLNRKKWDDGICYSDINTPDYVYKYVFNCASHDELDRKKMVDLIIEYHHPNSSTSEPAYDVIQIKNTSFLFGSGYDFDKDYAKLKEAANASNENGVGYYFAFYTDNGWLKKSDGKFTFNSKEVFELFDNNTIEERKKIVRDKINNNEYIFSKLL